MVNGLLAIVIAGIVSLSPVAPFSVPEHGGEEGRTSLAEQFTELWNPSSFSGAYYKGEKLHISVVDKDAVLRTLSKLRIDPSDVVFEPAMKYTHKQLLDAQAKLMGNHGKNAQKYGIKASSINSKYNCLVVRSSKEWTKERKKKVIDAVGIDCFQFSDGIIDHEDEEGFVGREPPQWVKDLDWSRFDE